MRISSIGRRAAITLIRCTLVLRDLVQGGVLLALLLARRNVFSPDYYVAMSLEGRRPRFPRLHYAFVGARRLADPNPWFSQTTWLRDHPRIAGRGYVPVLFYLLFDPVSRGVVPAASSSAARPEDVAVPARTREDDGPDDRFHALWPAIQADMLAIRDHERYLSGAQALGDALSARRRRAAVPVVGRALHAALGILPTGVEHLLVLPWLNVAGGSERITQRLIAMLRDHYGRGGLAIVAPDYSFDLTREQCAALPVPIVAFNHLLEGEGPPHAADTRLDLLDRILVSRSPRTLHFINSSIGWKALKDRGRYYRVDSNIFVNIYSDIRALGGEPEGAFWNFLPDCFDNIYGIFCDNHAVVRKAGAFFSLTRSEMAKFHVAYTPVLGLDHGDLGLRAFRPCCDPRSLWMSRIAVEKRVDLVGEIARAMPSREFALYGATVKGAMPVDMSDLMAQPNVTIRGEYGALDDVPFERFDSHVFTTRAEGLPIALLEVAQNGLPSVAPDIGGIGEFIDGRTGWLVPAEATAADYVAALEEIRRDPAEAGRRVAAAQRRLIERHSWAAFRAAIHRVPGYLHGGITDPRHAPAAPVVGDV